MIALSHTQDLSPKATRLPSLRPAPSVAREPAGAWIDSDYIRTLRQCHRQEGRRAPRVLDPVLADVIQDDLLAIVRRRLFDAPTDLLVELARGVEDLREAVRKAVRAAPK